ncbi:hypothetical protein F0562_012006 [Nyssa sinensis]|uniref:Uncharacterized protein n=1 Tax=Nyssa sinensis TaxID=561372 RepID=A0A5J4ZR75_9ASTE|nr:hypothetical protein F0562_012006 [Nyssa sinensis]
MYAYGVATECRRRRVNGCYDFVGVPRFLPLSVANRVTTGVAVRRGTELQQMVYSVAGVCAQDSNGSGFGSQTATEGQYCRARERDFLCFCHFQLRTEVDQGAGLCCGIGCHFAPVTFRGLRLSNEEVQPG